MRIFRCLIFPVVCFSLLAGCASTTSQTEAVSTESAAAQALPNPDEIVCRSIPATDKRPARKACMKQEDWDVIDARNAAR